MSFRVGTVEYLNAKPLTWALERGEIPDVEVVSDVPARLAGMLLDGKLDAALVSSVVAIEDPEVRLAPAAGCIAADGPVQSVLLFSKVHIDQVRRVALDASSLASAQLLRVILERRYGLRPDYVTLSPDLPAMLADNDAALLIGDPGLSQYLAGAPLPGLYDVYDLGREWHEWTGLPFVFAGWSVRADDRPTELVKLLIKGRERSLRRIPEIAEDAAARLGLTAEVCRHYLTNVVHYEFGERERQGYELFATYVLERERR